MSTEKRMVIAIAVSFLVIVVWSMFLAPPPPEKPVNQQAVTTEQPAGEPAAAPEEATAGEASIAAVEESEDEGERIATGEQAVVIESPLYRVELSNRGGGSARSWQLKKYEATYSTDVLDLIAEREIVGDEFLPYATILRAEKDRYEQLPGLPVVEAEVSGGTVAFVEGRATVRFIYRQSEFGVIIKEFVFHENSYLVDVTFRAEIERRKNRQAFMLLGPGLGQLLRTKDGGIIEAANENDGFLWRKSGEAAAHVPAFVREVGKPADDAPLYTEIEMVDYLVWAGLENSYFMNLAFSAQAGGFLPTYQLTRTYTVASSDKEKYFVLPYLAIKPITERPEFSLYVGPKDLEILETAAGGRLKEVVNFGWFSFISRPGLWLLQQINGFTHNYGFAIILLTIFISIVTLPLIIKQRNSMAAMQKIQPQIKAIQNKYKAERGDDIQTRQEKKQKLNEELMALYKVENVNPMGGCLPLLIQLPILMAFFDMIRVAIELRKAPFILWWDNLALADQTFILPILMGVAMFFSQKLTPAPAESQAGALKFLPFIFVFLFASAPSGLVLYWLTSSVFNLGTQIVMGRTAPVTAAPDKSAAVQKKGRSKSGR